MVNRMDKNKLLGLLFISIMFGIDILLWQPKLVGYPTDLIIVFTLFFPSVFCAVYFLNKSGNTPSAKGCIKIKPRVNLAAE